MTRTAEKTNTIWLNPDTTVIKAFSSGEIDAPWLTLDQRDQILRAIRCIKSPRPEEELLRRIADLDDVCLRVVGTLLTETAGTWAMQHYEYAKFDHNPGVKPLEEALHPSPSEIRIKVQGRAYGAWFKATLRPSHADKLGRLMLKKLTQRRLLQSCVTK